MRDYSRSIKSNARGVTLLEVLLVLVIASSLIFMSVGYMQQKAMQSRIDRTSIQMQQVLNAGLAFYVANGKWPADGALSPTYLTSSAFIPPWAGSVGYSYGGTTEAFYVWVMLPASIMKTTLLPVTNIIAGILPGGYTTNNATGTNPVGTPTGGVCAVGGDCWIVASVSVPGQNLNNATAVNFAGLYHHGGCIPVPTCPPNTTAKVMVIPVQISGVNDTGSANTYPIGSFAAYATGGTDVVPSLCLGSTTASPDSDCSNPAYNNGPVATKYWRACAQVVTQKGNVQGTRSDVDLGQWATLLAITRCAISNETAGSTWNVYSN